MDNTKALRRETGRWLSVALVLASVGDAAAAGATIIRPGAAPGYTPPFTAASSRLAQDLPRLYSAVSPTAMMPGAATLAAMPRLDPASGFDRRVLGALAARLPAGYEERLSGALAAGDARALTVLSGELTAARAAASADVVVEVRRRAAEVQAQWREGSLAPHELEAASRELSAFALYGEEARAAALPALRLARTVRLEAARTRDDRVTRALRRAGRGDFSAGEADALADAARAEGADAGRSALLASASPAAFAKPDYPAAWSRLQPHQPSPAESAAPKTASVAAPRAAPAPTSPVSEGVSDALDAAAGGLRRAYAGLRGLITGESGAWTPERLAAVAATVEKEGELAAVPELESVVRELERVLASPELERGVAGDVPLQRFRTSARISLKHIQFRFDSAVDSPAYELYYRAPFPAQPTLEAIERVRWFLATVDQTRGTSFESSVKASIEALAPLRETVIAARGRGRASATPAAAEQREGDVVDRLLADPVGEYARLRDRLREQGENAKFRDAFEGPVRGMIAALEESAAQSVVKEHASLDSMRRVVLGRLRELDRPGVDEPYRPTLDAIIRTLVYFDVVERSKYGESKDYHKVEQSWLVGAPEERLIEPLYHFDRYQYHWFSVLADRDLVIIPTARPLDFMDLVKVRSVPIGLLGIESRTVWADRHYQSPVDFFFHDVNHVRRMTGYMNGVLAKAGAKTDAQKEAVYREMNEFLDGLAAATVPSPVYTGRAAGRAAWEKEEAIKKLVRAIVFEIVHESALAPTKELMVYDLTRTPTTTQPFEYMTVGAERVADLEKERRTDAGSLASGVQFLDEAGRHLKGDVWVHYTMDRALSFLSTVHNKMTRNFYDSVYDPDEKFMPVRYRTPEMVAEAGQRLFELMGVPSPGLATLTEWAASTDGNLERFVKYTDHAKARELKLNVGSLQRK